MKLSSGLALSALLVLAVSRAAIAADELRLSALDLEGVVQDWGRPHADKSVEGRPMTIGGKTFEHGIGTHAASVFAIELDGNAERFQASVGIDDEVADDPNARGARVEFRVVGDGKVLWKSGRMRAGEPAKPVDVPLKGVRVLVLQVVPTRGDDINYCHADWAEARITYGGAKPRARVLPPEPRIVLTPKPPATPRINGPRVFGVRPGKPVLFKVPATGQRPMQFGAENLPEGLSIDPENGLITGKVDKAGTYIIRTKATNGLGVAERDLRLEVGDRIALTPPMGWNSWNCFAGDVSADKIKWAADAMVSSGLIEHGWTYINIDDCWQVRTKEPMDKRRDSQGRILTNDRFPDMKALADYIHGRGLKAGLYSSPGPATCAGFAGSYKFEEIDARTYAEWGYDFLKYDWCAYGGVAEEIRRQPNRPAELEIHMAPYRLMHEALAKQDRDIVYSLCQYGMQDVSKWGDEVGGQLWRTTGDIIDSWGSMSSIGFSQAKWTDYAKPGNWNDPDMLVVGKVGWGPKLRETRLTPNEQYTHITLWSMLAAPLLIGCDLTQMDEFTLGLLTNDEVIAVNQDPLGRQASRIVQNEDETEIWVKELEGGDRAVALFNRGELPVTMKVKWSDLGISGSPMVRDLWRQKDLGTMTDYEVEIPRHGTVMVRLSDAK